MARPGQARLHADLSYDYRTNVAAYPAWQAWLREHRPPLLVLWGKYDTAFAVPGATAFLREVPEAEVHILNAGHFATEEEVEPCVSSRRFDPYLHSKSALSARTISSIARVTCRTRGTSARSSWTVSQ